jgi:hypothetical protein
MFYYFFYFCNRSRKIAVFRPKTLLGSIISRKQRFWGLKMPIFASKMTFFSRERLLFYNFIMLANSFNPSGSSSANSGNAQRQAMVLTAHYSLPTAGRWKLVAIHCFPPCNQNPNPL